MYKQLAQFFNNQKREGTELEKLLGNSSRISQFAQFYAKHSEVLAVIAAAALLEYTSDPNKKADHDKVVAFQEGLAQFPVILEKCFKEIEIKKESPPDTKS